MHKSAKADGDKEPLVAWANRDFWGFSGRLTGGC